MSDIFVVLGRLLKYILIHRLDNIVTCVLYAHTYQAACLQPHTQSKTDRKRALIFRLQNRERETEEGRKEGGRE